MQPSTQSVTTDKVPPFDCPTFEKRVYECRAEFTQAYGATPLAKIVQGNTPEEKAQAVDNTLRILKNLKQSPCNAPPWSNLAIRDPEWQVRYNKSDADAPCAVWGECAGKAFGLPMTQSR